jgi:hypothetical protein
MLRLLEDSVDGKCWDNFTQTPYFQYQLRYDNGSLEQHQVYYDNGRSLRLKYEYAKDSGVQGVAMWTANSIDNTNATQVDEFWSAVRSFIPSRLKVDDFEIAWNSPWPAASACGGEHIPSDALTRWGIKCNSGNALNGDVVTILYNHPGMSTIGDWPTVWPNGSICSNGGIPQAANLTRHLEQVTIDIERRFPDRSFDGIVAIDWEVWNPWLDPRDTSVYAEMSFAHAHGDKVRKMPRWPRSWADFSLL